MLIIDFRRWIFYISAIVSSCVFLLLLLKVLETRPSKVLESHVKILKLHAGKLELRTKTVDDSIPDFQTFCQTAIAQPANLFFEEPKIFTMATLSAIAFSLVFLFTEALDIVFVSLGFSDTSYTLAFIAYLAGMFVSIPVRWLEFKKLGRLSKEKGKLEPEDRITGFVIGAPALALGLWILGVYSGFLILHSLILETMPVYIYSLPKTEKTLFLIS